MNRVVLDKGDLGRAVEWLRARGIAEKFNPNHDEMGRFAGGGAGEAKDKMTGKPMSELIQHHADRSKQYAIEAVEQRKVAARRRTLDPETLKKLPTTAADHEHAARTADSLREYHDKMKAHYEDAKRKADHESVARTKINSMQAHGV